MPDHSAPPPGLLPEVRYLFTVRDHLVAWRVRRVELHEAVAALARDEERALALAIDHGARRGERGSGELLGIQAIRRALR